jgi:alkylhydroperoxidase family enzyme
MPLVEPQSDPDVEQAFRRRVGMVSGAVPYVVPHPWLYRPFLFLSDPALAALNRDFASSISFIIARDNSCRFCYSTFRTLLRLSNYSPSDLEDLENHFSAQDFDEAEEWGLRFAVRISRCEHVQPALDQLRALGYSGTAIREMAGISVLNLAANRIGTTLSIPVGTFEGMADAWYLQPWRTVVAPLVRLIEGGQDGGASPSAGAPAGPMARWVGTLRGTPAGSILASLTRQWLSPDRPLSVRAKRLMLAVVARGTAAHELEAHLRAKLQDEHDLAPDALEDATDHFGGEAVGPETEPLLRFARASIRYDFGPIKRVAYECTDGLSRAETLEAVASISLANALARLEQLFVLEDD